MRIGENPEKSKQNLNVLKKHRIVVVFYIPDSNDNYYEDLDIILDKCLKSIFDSINITTTAVTLINNNSSPKINVIVNKYSKLIDKYVLYNDNKGKVYAVINEVRGVFEDFVTITDADIIFFKGWENQVFSVFLNYPKAGVVSPYPSMYTAFINNRSVFGINTFKNKIKYSKIVSDADISLFVKGTNLSDIILRKNSKTDWQQKQYFLEKPFPVVVGAYHIVSTYKTLQFRNIYTFPEQIFKNSYEDGFIDYLADKKGLYRLSTIKTHIYHMGNVNEDFIEINNDFVNEEEIDFCKINLKTDSQIFIFFNRMLGRFLIHFKWNRFYRNK